MKCRCLGTVKGMVTSHPARGAWIEIQFPVKTFFRKSSHPARGAWIEIVNVPFFGQRNEVAPRKGCVD